MATGPFPLIMTAQGPVPVSPATLLAALIAGVVATNPGYIANLPGTLIEDVASTDIGAAQLCDSARVESLNNVSPYAANAYMANELGAVYGVPIGLGSNTSVEVQFNSSTPNFPIIPGFVVGDGQQQYIIQDAGVIAADGTSGLLNAVAVNQGSWPIPANTVVNVITSVPSGVTLNVTNPQVGTPGQSGQLISDYQAQVLQAGLAASMGMTRYLKTLVNNIPGVQTRLISARSVTSPAGFPSWEIIVGGGDNTQVANAIFNSLFDISTLVGSVLNVLNITNANPAVVQTQLNHGYDNGDVIQITGVVMSGFPNGVNLTVTVIDEKHFSIGIDSTGFGTYISGGVCNPNFRNVVETIANYPDSYQIPFVNPPEQSVLVTIAWNTNLANFSGDITIQQLANPAIVNYINSIPVGAPINELEMTAVFQAAIASILSPVNLTRLVFSISINGVPTSPDMGTGIVEGDPESFFFTNTTSVTIARG